MRRQLIEYLHGNWGAPLIMVFIVAMLVSIYGPMSQDAGSQSFGGAPPAVAVIAVSSFLIGVVLQIASYMVYRNK